MTYHYKLSVYCFFILVISVPNLYGQYSLNKSYDNLEIRGNITSMFKGRIYPGDSDFTNQKLDKSLFRLKDARIRFKGSSNKKQFSYELQLDFANMMSNDIPEVPVLDANVTLRTFADITMGYQKLPFSRESLIPIIYTPWLKRSMIVDEGQARRDVGIHLEKNFLNDRINFYTSLVNGMPALTKTNDDSLGFEFVSRVDFSYPTKMKFRALDLANSKIPVFSLGLNYRNSSKSQNYDADDEDIWTGIDGEKKSYIIDFATFYRGFSFLLETHRINYNYNRNTIFNVVDSTYVDISPFYHPSSNGSTRTDGFLSQVSYYSERFKSALSIRYDLANINQGSLEFKNGKKEESIGVAYNYFFNSHLSIFKLQIIRTNFNYESRPNMIEIRAGLQYIIG